MAKKQSEQQSKKEEGKTKWKAKNKWSEASSQNQRGASQSFTKSAGTIQKNKAVTTFHGLVHSCATVLGGDEAKKLRARKREKILMGQAQGEEGVSTGGKSSITGPVSVPHIKRWL